MWRGDVPAAIAVLEAEHGEREERGEIVAGRQKGRGMQWRAATSAAVAGLRTLMLNGGWDRYWQNREVLPLLAA